MRTRISLSILLLFAGLGPSAASASDGVFEINQACATQTGCFAGDTLGFPVTITSPGSYRLTSNLIVPGPSTDGVNVSTSDVGIDLNNFAIIRSGCEDATTSCAPTFGNGSGVERASSENRGIAVKNGSITGMGGSGVLLGDQAVVSGLRVRWNRGRGISAGGGSNVLANTAYQNGDDGIQAGLGSTVSGNTTYNNGGNGIYASNGSTISGNTTYLNGDDGIHAVFASTVLANTVHQNGDDGIDAGAGSLVADNSVRSSSAYGLNLAADAVYRGNVITNSSLMGPVNGGLNLLNNSCDGATTCP